MLPKLYIFVLLLLSCGAHAVSLDESSSEIKLDSQLLIAEDASSSWSLEDAINALADSGKAWTDPGFPNFGFSTSSYWASVTIDNNFATNQRWLARLNFASIDRVDLHYQDENGFWVQKSAGDTLPFSERDVKNHAIMFSFPVLAGQTQSLYFRIQTNSVVQMPLSLLSMEEFQQQSSNELFWAGIYYGMIAVIALYSLIVWASSADKSYLYYVLFLFFGALYSFAFQGFAYQYLWPDNPFWANRSSIVFVALLTGSGMMFVRSFLEIASVSKRYDKVLFSAAIFSLIFAALALLLPYALISRGLIAFVVLALIVVSIASWIAWLPGYRPASYFMGAWSVLLISIVIELIQRLGVSISPFLGYHSIQFGTVFALVLLSLGLGDKISLLINDYGHVQGDILKANQLKIEALQKADQLKEEFIANVSHEMRTPLTGIIGLSEIILENQAHNLDESVRENLTMIKVSGQRLSNLVNDVIDFSAITNGHLELNKRAVDLKSICILVSKMCRPLIGDKSIQLAENYPIEPVWVLGDEDRLQQIFFNLVSNAIKFTQRGWVALSIEIIDSDARVTVKDTGIGISRDQQTRIFTRFYQIDATESREEGGTGLGLSISQKLVEMHGTEIILRSSLGEGSTFHFDLPLLAEKDKALAGKNKALKKLAQDADQKRALVTAAPEPFVDRRTRGEGTPLSLLTAVQHEGQRRKILVVDDEYLNLHIVKEHLSSLYDITTAMSGHDALVMIEQKKPDLIILDLMMPMMTGFELCQRVRAQYSMDELPIVMLTAKNRVEDLVKGLNMGANDYISKPFSKEELKVRIGKQFEMLSLINVRSENQQLYWQLQKYQESEKKLRARETRLAKMLDVTGDALISIDESGVVIYVNKAAEELLGISAAQFQEAPLSRLAERLIELNSGLSEVVSFPFKESVISDSQAPTYFNFVLNMSSVAADDERVRVCLLPLNLDQEFYLLMFERVSITLPTTDENISEGSLPELIGQINRNVERTQVLTEYLARITPEDLQKHRHLFSDLENVDRIIQSLASVLPTDGDGEQQYREALVKLMQDCHYYWQKVTGESIIELAEKSRIWSVSIDNGRLRTRSMNRYLSIDKLPANPRWRQVARTAYFVLSKVSHEAEAKSALEKSVAHLQDIVESKALT